MARKPTPAIDRFSKLWELDQKSGCWLWIGCKGLGGYGYFDRKGAHRFSYEHYKGPIHDGLWVLHSCDTRMCVNPDHLHLGTNSDNIREAVARGRHKSGLGYVRSPDHLAEIVRRNVSRTGLGNMKFVGSNHPNSKLTENNVANIRHMLSIGETISSIAKSFGVSHRSIRFIKNNVTWKHVT